MLRYPSTRIIVGHKETEVLLKRLERGSPERRNMRAGGKSLDRTVLTDIGSSHMVEPGTPRESAIATQPQQTSPGSPLDRPEVSASDKHQSRLHRNLLTAAALDVVVGTASAQYANLTSRAAQEDSVDLHSEVAPHRKSRLDTQELHPRLLSSARARRHAHSNYVLEDSDCYAEPMAPLTPSASYDHSINRRYTLPESSGVTLRRRSQPNLNPRALAFTPSVHLATSQGFTPTESHSRVLSHPSLRSQIELRTQELRIIPLSEQNQGSSSRNARSVQGLAYADSIRRHVPGVRSIDGHHDHQASSRVGRDNFPAATNLLERYPILSSAAHNDRRRHSDVASRSRISNAASERTNLSNDIGHGTSRQSIVPRTPSPTPSITRTVNGTAAFEVAGSLDTSPAACRVPESRPSSLYRRSANPVDVTTGYLRFQSSPLDDLQQALTRMDLVNTPSMQCEATRGELPTARPLLNGNPFGIRPIRPGAESCLSSGDETEDGESDKSVREGRHCASDHPGDARDDLQEEFKFPKTPPARPDDRPGPHCSPGLRATTNRSMSVLSIYNDFVAPDLQPQTPADIDRLPPKGQNLTLPSFDGT